MSIYESEEKADKWNKSDCWIAVFDILGFSNLIATNKDDMQAFYIRVDYEETIRHLKDSCESYKSGSLQYCWFSDTFLMYTSDDSAESYIVIQYASKYFIEKCIYSRVPIRGAISFGVLYHTEDNRSFIGTAFLEAFEYAEDQDWIGLLITPSAVKKAESLGMYPTRHDFVQSNEIPLRKCNRQNVLAYRFQNGAANFPSPLIPILCDMKGVSKDIYRRKYENTEKFIQRNYRYVDTSPTTLRQCD
jgi:hypothetical protein